MLKGYIPELLRRPVWGLCIALLFLGGCATSTPWQEPVPLEQVDFRQDAATMARGELSVTVAIPDREQSRRIFGTPLYDKGIQPVWVEVKNSGQRDYLLLKPGVDPMLYSPLEVAWQSRSAGDLEWRRLEAFFLSLEFRNPVRAGQVTSGFLFTPVDEGHKAVNIDLLGNHVLRSFTLVVKVPGLITDSSQVDFDHLYDHWQEIDSLEELRRVLESLPCCTTDRSGERFGDPLNLVFIGRRDTLLSALVRSGWKQTEITHRKALAKTIASFLFGSRYLYSPISALYVFGRSQDISFQKARDSISRRNHMRIWRTPWNFRGKEVYIGQVSRDVGVKFNRRTFTTHAIDPDVDLTRDNLVADLAYSQAVKQVGFVRGSRVSTPEKTYYNLTPDPYYSDGNRAVLFFSEEPTPLDRIELLPWEHTIADTITP